MAITSGRNQDYQNDEEYRNSIIKTMEEYVKEIKEDLPSISPILDRIFDKAKSYPQANKRGMILKPALKLRFLQDNSMTFLRAILEQTTKFKNAKHRILVERAIFIIGAGISFESDAPMTSDLDDVLRFTGAGNYAELRSDPDKCYLFKKKFKDLVDRSSPGKSHELIMKNFPTNVIEIICLNWDNLIERAFGSSNKPLSKINKETSVDGSNHLWKFHGDIEEFDNSNVKGKLGWVFPDEGGYVLNCFNDYMANSGLSSELFSLFIVGYSEKDEQVKDVIEALESNPPRPTYRIGMDIARLNDDFYLLGPSPFVLTRILA